MDYTYFGRKTDRCKNNKSEGKTVKTFLKWAGGKSQLLKETERYYSFADERITKYAEPFVGDGAVLFDILSKCDLEEVYISDINAELINTYRIIRNDIDALVDMLYTMQNDFIPLDTDARKAYYMEKRECFNDLKVNSNENINIEKATLIIFLNKTCFNSLFRVNKKGLFNVPMGTYKNPMICDKSNLRAVSEKLQIVTIVCRDYRESADFIDENTFVYFDPPHYRPITDTASFTTYTENLFNDKEQIELARFVDDMQRKGAKVIERKKYKRTYTRYETERLCYKCNGEKRRLCNISTIKSVS